MNLKGYRAHMSAAGMGISIDTGMEVGGQDPFCPLMEV